MLLIGVVLIVISLTLFPSHVLLIIGIILALLGLFGNGYAHFGTPAGGRRRYWY